MPYYVVQHGSAASIVASDGTITALTLPTGITIVAGRVPRFAVWKREVIMVNAPSGPIAIDRNANVRVFVPNAPTGAPTLVATGTGGLSGVYLVRVSFLVKDAFGTILAESGLGPPSAASATLASDLLQANNIPISAQTISARRLYRTTAGGTTYFPWIDVDGNTVTTVTNDLSDAGLQLVAAPVNLGSAPNLTLISEWRGRLWGVGRDNIDTLRHTGADLSYAWDPDLEHEIGPMGSDRRGIVALIRRRDELGVVRWSSMSMITGNTDDDFTRVVISEGIGCASNESVQIVEDDAYFLGTPYGIYKWSDNGLQCISNDKVRAWFATDTYFNRARFEYAKSNYDPAKNIYSVHLAAAGSSVEDRWIYYDIEADHWYGPHKTGEFTPTAAGLLTTEEDKPLPTIGSSSGFLWKEQDTRTDGTSTPIVMDCDSPFLSGGPPAPDIDKVFLELAMITKINAYPSGTLTITPKVGGMDATAGPVIEHDLSLGRERLPRLGGPGRFAQLNFYQATAGTDVVIYGWELEYYELGRR